MVFWLHKELIEKYEEHKKGGTKDVSDSEAKIESEATNSGSDKPE